MIYLLNSAPNSLIIPESGKSIKIEGISEAKTSEALKKGFTSAIGHASFADVLERRLQLNVPTNRINVSPKNGDVLIIAAVINNVRLPEGQLLSEKEILALPIRYAMIKV